MVIGLVLKVHRPVASLIQVTTLLHPPLQAAVMVAPAIGRSSAPWTAAITLAFHQLGVRPPPVSVRASVSAAWITARTSTGDVAVADAPSSSVTVNEIEYVPGAGNRNDGEAALEVPALPKVHARDTMTPSLSVLWSMNVHVRSTHEESNRAVGATFPEGATAVTVVLSESDRLLESVTVSVTVYVPAAEYV